MVDDTKNVDAEVSFSLTFTIKYQLPWNYISQQEEAAIKMQFYALDNSKDIKHTLNTRANFKTKTVINKNSADQAAA